LERKEKTLKKARLNENRILLKFKGNDFKKILEKIKTIPAQDRKFIGASSEWEIVWDDEYVEMLHKLNFDLHPDVYNKWKGTQDINWRRVNQIAIPEEYEKVMRPFQKKTMKLIKYFKFRAGVGLPVGSGKSLIAMAVIDWKEKFPVLMVTTSSTTHNLKREYFKWVNKDDRIKIIKNTNELIDYKGAYDIFIINYEKFSRQIDFVGKKKVPTPSQKLVEFRSNKFEMILTDEAQKYANENSKTYHSIKYLSEGVPYFLALSATFINNKTKEIFNMANILKPKVFPNRYSFLNRFCDPQWKFLGKGRKIRTFDGLSNAAELHTLLKNNLLIRFKPEEVMPDLPPVVQSIVPVDLDNYDEYIKIEEEFSEHAKTDEDNTATGLQKMQALMKCCYENKASSCLSFTDDLLDNTDKIVIFIHNKALMGIVMEHYGDRALKIDGSIPMDERLNLIDKFIEDPKINIFALNLIAGKEGLDGLHLISTTMVLYQDPFTSGALIQAIGRLNRMNKIGITKVYHLVGRNTVDEKVLEIIQEKQATSDAVIDGEFDGKGQVSNMYKELIKMYKEKK